MFYKDKYRTAQNFLFFNKTKWFAYLTLERVTFLRDPFVKFAKDHVKLRVLTGIMAGQVGYVVRILKNRQLVMDFGGYAVAINNVHNEDFEIAE